MTDAAGRLSGRVCVITGAAGGVGRATARRLSQEGATVVGVDLAEHAVGELCLQADVTDEDQVRDLYARVRDELGRIDVLFNNAGVNDPRDGSALDTSLETWSRVQTANLTSVFLCCKHGIPHLLANEPAAGSVINWPSAGCRPTVAYLASDDAGYVTASAFPLDGGITAAYTIPS